jgi:hypothetical protein
LGKFGFDCKFILGLPKNPAKGSEENPEHPFLFRVIAMKNDKPITSARWIPCHSERGPHPTPHKLHQDTLKENIIHIFWQPTNGQGSRKR